MTNQTVLIFEDNCSEREYNCSQKDLLLIFELIKRSENPRSRIDIVCRKWVSKTPRPRKPSAYSNIFQASGAVGSICALLVVVDPRITKKH